MESRQRAWWVAVLLAEHSAQARQPARPLGSKFVRTLAASTVPLGTGAITRTAAETFALALTLALSIALLLTLGWAGAVVGAILAPAAALADFTRWSDRSILLARPCRTLLSRNRES